MLTSLPFANSDRMRPLHMEQEIHFCKTDDGVRIAYATVGEGPPLVKAANWLSHLEFDWSSPIWRHLLAEFARDHQLPRSATSLMRIPVRSSIMMISPRAMR